MAGRYSEVISVGALAANGRDRARFSNYGKWVEIFAPGQDLTNAFPLGNLCVHRASDRADPGVHGMAEWNGTSFSAPSSPG